MSLKVRGVFADLFNFVFRPKRFAASATLPVRSIYHSLLRTVFSTEVKRRSLLDQGNAAKPMFTIPEKAGYLRIGSLIDESLKQDVILAAKQLMDKKLTPEYIKKFEGAPFVSVPIEQNLTSLNPFLKFALQKNLIKSLTNYFGIVPVIENISIWYSPNQSKLSGSSQFYHLDGQDVKTIQLFLFIEDVNPDNGPLVFVEAEKSEQIARAIKYRKTRLLRRVDDDLVKSHCTPEQIVQATGPAGESYVVDTDRCFHYGSRQGTRPRYVIVFQYYSPFAFTLPWRWWTKLPFAKTADLNKFSPLEKAVLGARN